MSGQKELPEIMKLIGKRAKNVDTEEGRRIGLSFKPKSTDVVITSAMKSGTTWIQQICHGLRTRGNMEFEEIAAVIPMLEDAHCYGYGDLDQEQVAHPRMYKTHTTYHTCPKGFGRHIIIVRDPRDSMVSFYHFLANWLFKPEELSLEDFVYWFFLQDDDLSFPNAGHLDHIGSWYPHRNDPDKLWIHYEDLKEDLSGCVKRISEFLQIGVGDEELLDLVTKQASFDFMKQHSTKFDDHLLKLARNGPAGLPKDAGLGKDGGKVRNGQVLKGSALSTEMLQKMNQRWIDVMEPLTGHSSYDSMRSSINHQQLQREM